MALIQHHQFQIHGGAKERPVGHLIEVDGVEGAQEADWHLARVLHLARVSVGSRLLADNRCGGKAEATPHRQDALRHARRHQMEGMPAEHL